MKNIKFPIVIYSHTDYVDILSVQSHYLKSFNNKILLINDSNLDDEIKQGYDRIITYDDSLPYASRLHVLDSIDAEYILFMHDIDVVVKSDIHELMHLYDIAVDNNLDRIDLKYNGSFSKKNEYTSDIDINSKYDYELVQSEGSYRYNVNASIWRRSALLDIMRKFPMHSYRNIELTDVQHYCKDMKIYTLFSNQYINCGHFGCMPFFQFIHLTHAGKLLGKTNNPNDCGPYQNLHPTLQGIYQSILDDFQLLTTRELDTRYYGSDYYHGPCINVGEK